MTAPKPINYDTLRAMFERQDAERAEAAPSPTTTAMRNPLVLREAVNNNDEDHDE